MSVLWVLGLGASLGYLALQRREMTTRLEDQVREWDQSGNTPSQPRPPDGADFGEVRAAWRMTDSHERKQFNERLPEAEVQQTLAARDAERQLVEEYDGPPQQVEGVYLEMFA